MDFDEFVRGVFRLFVSEEQEQAMRDAFADPGGDLTANRQLNEEYYEQLRSEDAAMEPGESEIHRLPRV